MEDPDDFKPERWLEPDAAALNERFLPFSLGRRQCVGQNLAMLELRMVLAPITQRFHLKLVNVDVESEYFFTFKPHAAEMCISRRN